jgi:hypothetical protein
MFQPCKSRYGHHPREAAIISSGGGVQRGNLFQEVPPLVAEGTKKTARLGISRTGRFV